MTNTKKELLIGIVGPCSSGKSTLVAGLKKHMVHARNIAQEHSYVKDMWRRLINPDLLIFLQVSYPIAQIRRKLNWNLADYEEQGHRLRHARKLADFYLDTDLLTPKEVLEAALDFIKESSDA
ncbi:MAG: hypothetical protein ISR59_06295 [Anaerolineales bacterium]|uniref:Uncharacterized protein n=1 Tax=Candidatus Desulfolinea nitratireducens TaxID=2841698 RepID=A0A8J6TJ98_9CHLR|nr:hypothetical protein [Candidatus Desulfolinea nitratireducens]MBL6960702.1 hypothetical protein [Anaerolineales bacterium]